MQIGEFKLANPDKLERAINGSVLSQGQMKGGVGKDAKPAEILAEYDRLGGLILMNGKYKVKTGCFFDVKKNKPVAKPKPILLFNINGEIIEVDGSKPLPLEVQAAEQAEARKAAKRKAAEDKKKAKKAKKSSKKKAKAKDDEDELEEEDEELEDDESDEDDEDSDDEDSEDDEDGDLA